MKQWFLGPISKCTVFVCKLFSKKKGVNSPTLQETAEEGKEGLGINAKEFGGLQFSVVS